MIGIFKNLRSRMRPAVDHGGCGVSCETLKFKKLRRDAVVPRYAHDGDAGFDFYLPDDVVIAPGEMKVKVPLGIAAEIPTGHFMAISVRSSTGLKTTVRLSNQWGVVDEGYRGELCLILDNISETEWAEFKRGDRIAQGIILKKPLVKIVEADRLSDSSRGKGGFGSTGK